MTSAPGEDAIDGIKVDQQGQPLRLRPRRPLGAVARRKAPRDDRRAPAIPTTSRGATRRQTLYLCARSAPLQDAPRRRGRRPARAADDVTGAETRDRPGIQPDMRSNRPLTALLAVLVLAAPRTPSPGRRERKFLTLDGAKRPPRRRRPTRGGAICRSSSSVVDDAGTCSSSSGSTRRRSARSRSASARRAPPRTSSGRRGSSRSRSRTAAS